MATMIRLMQPNDLSSSSSSILCLLSKISVCLPSATDNKTFKAHTLGAYPFGNSFSDILLWLALTDVFKQRRATKCGSAKIEGKRYQTIKLPLRLAYSEVVDVVFARQQVAFEQRHSLRLRDGLTLLYPLCMSDTDSPHSCGAFVCGQLTALKLDNFVD